MPIAIFPPAKKGDEARVRLRLIPPRLLLSTVHQPPHQHHVPQPINPSTHPSLPTNTAPPSYTLHTARRTAKSAISSALCTTVTPSLHPRALTRRAAQPSRSQVHVQDSRRPGTAQRSSLKALGDQQITRDDLLSLQGEPTLPGHFSLVSSEGERLFDVMGSVSYLNKLLRRLMMVERMCFVC
jgi:hypothetical protein